MVIYKREKKKLVIPSGLYTSTEALLKENEDLKAKIKELTEKQNKEE